MRRRNQYALARFKAVQTRPSTVAAKEFFSNGGGTREMDSLPRRLDRLVQVLGSWVRTWFANYIFDFGSSFWCALPSLSYSDAD